MKNHTTNTHKDIYQIVTNRIIGYLEKGVVPWQQPWTDAGPPRNLITGKPYRGINLILLNTLRYKQNCFLTFKQVQELGGKVKKGEKSELVVFFKQIEKENQETKEKEQIPVLRYYNVFNIEQCEGLPKDKLPEVTEYQNNPIEACEKIISEMHNKPKITHQGDKAYYSKIGDYINMPKMETFKSSESYYGALFHELVHSTGHHDRLNRKEIVENNRFGSENYAIEELTAEMGLLS